MAGDGYRLAGLAIPEGVDELHDLLERAATEDRTVDPTDLMLFETAVIEIASNVVRHGTPAGGVRWRFHLEITADDLRATLHDDGDAFEGDVGREMPGQHAEGGRGLPLASTMLDELDYAREGEANVWRMVKHRAPGSEGQRP